MTQLCSQAPSYYPIRHLEESKRTLERNRLGQCDRIAQNKAIGSYKPRRFALSHAIHYVNHAHNAAASGSHGIEWNMKGAIIPGSL